MTATEEFERSISYGESALTYLKGNHTPAYPRNYELWYTYAAGFNRELNRAVNEAIKRLGRLSPEMTERFYEEFLSPVRLSDRVGEVSTQVSNELSQVVQLLQSSDETFGDYGQSLRNATRDLTEADSTERIRAIVNRLVSATSGMEERKTKLENQLKDSERQIRQLRESLEAIRFESLTDELTGLANRKHFDESLERAMEGAGRRGEPLTLIMSDIDHFKQFNDSYGHQTGDQVLRLVGAAIRGMVKGRDIAARYGGEEFGIILPNTTLEAGVTVANHIRAAVMTKELIKRSTGESLGRITMSSGVAAFRPDDSEESFVERADAALYAAKRKGRNQVADESDSLAVLDKPAVA